MNTANSDLTQRLRALHEDYAEKLPAKIAELYACWGELSADWQLESLSSFHRLAHTLAGSGATFGFEHVSHSARALEQTLKALVKNESGLNEQTSKTIERQLKELQHTAQHSIQTPPAEVSAMNVAPSSRSTASAAHARLYIYCPQEQRATKLAAQTGNVGYEVSIFTSLEDTARAIQERQPIAVIVKSTPHEAGMEKIDSRITGTPLVFISGTDDLDCRLTAVRYGGRAYFVEPIDISILVDTLDKLNIADRKHPYRVLIIETSAPLATQYALTLEQAGMEIEIVPDPMNVMRALSEFQPELIIMDEFMQSGSGIELAQVIRQHRSYTGVPIVFLSSEPDIEKQLEAMGRGGDAFLNKPIHGDHLVSSVSIHAERYRDLKSLMDHDSLTGLLNRAKVKQKLDVEVARADRHEGTLSVVMLDLDHFNTINDTYGHLTGDRVIKSLAGLLQQRLRKTDLIGRYGGEEFLIALSDSDAQTSLEILDEIRKRFEKINYQTVQGEFSATFSAGISNYPKHGNTDLQAIADRALYTAKSTGRNRIIIAN